MKEKNGVEMTKGTGEQKTGGVGEKTEVLVLYKRTHVVEPSHPCTSVWSRKTGRLLRLSLCRPLVLSLHCTRVLSSCRLVVLLPLLAPPSCRLVVPTGCRIVSRCTLVALPSHPLIAPAGCCVASPCAALSSRTGRPVEGDQIWTTAETDATTPRR